MTSSSSPDQNDCPRSIEETVRWRLFDHGVQVLKTRNVDRDASDIQAIIDDALQAARDR